ncbi:hypothetical protein FIE12Z_5080 [Fusarium flagelliforme]|uniref:F-box domain-containing protein n=1 Tax=Fusarium flagelliforme TaxID=2675880 RepID=A0A395MRS7_9HYPO|nr:hypothetical protein FIE12Z_5080 [Fusarium flagelliforme]
MASSWKSLPPEIRLLVLEYIIPRYGLEETTIVRGFPPASLLATVCKEWQGFFEKETFLKMDLEATDLYTFSRTILGENVIRLNYMTRVVLTIKLATYTWLITGEPESATTVTHNNETFTQAMEVLLKTLSSWEGSLEIRCHCPSTGYSLHAGEQISGLLAKTGHDFTQCFLPYDKSINWFWVFAELTGGDRHQDSKLENLAFRTRSPTQSSTNSADEERGVEQKVQALNYPTSPI